MTRWLTGWGIVMLVLAIPAALVVLHIPLPKGGTRPPARAAGPVTVSGSDSSFHAALGVLTRRNPFVAAVAGEGIQLVAEAVPRPATPTVTPVVLRGIVWGVSPLAVLGELPGLQGDRLVGVGDTTAGVRVRRIEVDYVVIVFGDSSRLLRLRPDELPH